MNTNFSSPTIQCLSQLKVVIQQLTDNEYACKLHMLSNCSLGMHIRHILEFYECLCVGISTGIVNYDLRKRNAILEENTTSALTCIDNFTLEIKKFSSNTTLILEGSQQIPSEGHSISTNLFRELTYLTEHTIHHMAILKIALLSEFPNIQIPENFGVAFSTLKYQQLVHGHLSPSE